MASRRAAERVEAWDPEVAGIREVFHARFVEHAYPRHSHEAWTVLVVDEGAIRYTLGRHDHGSLHSTVTVLPPYVTHDGRAARIEGFAKRVLYLEPSVLGDRLIGRAVDRPTIADPGLARRIGRLHDALRAAAPALEADTRLALVTERLVAHLAGTPDETAGTLRLDPRSRARDRSTSALAASVRDLLDAAPGHCHTLESLATQVGASRTHLVRSFTTAFGVPPHAYLLGRRIEQARRLLLDGRPAADVAMTLGFHDQAHLIRHFRRHVGTTPGRFGRRR